MICGEGVCKALAMSATGKKPARHVYKTGAAGCGGKAAPTAAKNAGQVCHFPCLWKNFSAC